MDRPWFGLRRANSPYGLSDSTALTTSHCRFGRDLTKEEAYIARLDATTGASLKLTVLNAEGSIWTMVAGGGASVVYSDAIAAHGFAHELANYGEYSGAPTQNQTYEYAKTIRASRSLAHSIQC